MAFTTVTGASGAPTTYTGTDGVDLLTLTNPGESVVEALAANDTINFNLVTATTTATGQTVRGGQGDDTFANTGSVTGANYLITSFIAGNLGNDAMFTTGTGVIATASTLQGGQGNDTINVAFTNGGTMVNGNLGNDTINAGTAVSNPGALATISATSLFGGQGNDTITVGGATTVNLSGVSIDGAIGNDTITVAALASVAATSVGGGDGDDAINTFAAGQDGLSIYGGDGSDVLQGTNAQADTIVSGSGRDQILTSGMDLATNGAGTTFTQLDVLTDYASNFDRIAYSSVAGTVSATAITLSAAVVVSATRAAVTANGYATFNTVTDQSLVGRTTAVDTAIGATTGQAAVFDGGDGFNYLYIAGATGTAGTLNTDDILIQLQGVTPIANGITLTGGQITAIG